MALAQRVSFGPTQLRSGAAGRVRTVSLHASFQINPSVKKDVEKVVDMLKVPDLPKKVLLLSWCRKGQFVLLTRHKRILCSSSITLTFFVTVCRMIHVSCWHKGWWEHRCIKLGCVAV